MTRTELEEKLKELTPNVYYDHTSQSDVITLPFIVYSRGSANHLKADNIVYKKMYYYTIYIHTNDVDEHLCEEIEELLTANMIPFNDSMEWDNELLMYTYQYEFML